MYIQLLCTHLNREIKPGVDCVSIFENICGSEKEKKNTWNIANLFKNKI